MSRTHHDDTPQVRLALGRYWHQELRLGKSWMGGDGRQHHGGRADAGADQSIADNALAAAHTLCCLRSACTQNASREARELEKFAADDADFWPLTAIDPSDALWAAWQLHQPTRGYGYVMYFRRSHNQTATFAVPWVGVLASAKYRLSYRYGYVAEGEESPDVEGTTLLAGLQVTLPQPASSLLVQYARVTSTTDA